MEDHAQGAMARLGGRCTAEVMRPRGRTSVRIWDSRTASVA
jgi:hypothetical protein